jgi:phytoene synthase
MSELLRLPYTMIRPLYERTSFHRSVIEELDNTDLQEAYAQCRDITKHHAKTFYMATRFLPNDKQRAIFAIYALCRYLDDLVDEAEDLILRKEMEVAEVERQLCNWKELLRETYDGRRYDNPILLALSDVLKQYHIPIHLPFALMDGVCMDLTKNRYHSFSEVYDYSYKVASVVGLMTSEVFGYSEESALEYAEALGIAMQLTNILRDVGEDLDRDRIYLPQDELREFGITEEDLFEHRLTDRFKAFMQFQIERARHYYNEADKGIPMLNLDSRMPVYLARYNYSRILDKIEENDYNVFQHRAYVSKSEKLSIIPKVWWNMKVSAA